MDTKTIILLVFAGVTFGAGYHFGSNDKELENALDKVQAVTRTLETERQKQNELAVANRKLSADTDRLNRMLKSQASYPRDLKTCVVERDRLRELVKEAGSLVIECRRGLDWCKAVTQ